MTFTYVLSTDIGKIRLIISDKDVTNPVFTNEELQIFIDSEGSVNLAAAAALEAWAAGYAANADSEHIGDYAYTQNIVKKMLDLAARLRESVAITPAMGIASMNLTGTTIEED